MFNKLKIPSAHIQKHWFNQNEIHLVVLSFLKLSTAVNPTNLFLFVEVEHGGWRDCDWSIRGRGGGCPDVLHGLGSFEDGGLTAGLQGGLSFSPQPRTVLLKIRMRFWQVCNINPFLFIKTKRLFISSEGFSTLEEKKTPWYVIRGQRCPSVWVWKPFAGSSGSLRALFVWIQTFWLGCDSP